MRPATLFAAAVLLAPLVQGQPAVQVPQERPLLLQDGGRPLQVRPGPRVQLLEGERPRRTEELLDQAGRLYELQRVREAARGAVGQPVGRQLQLQLQAFESGRLPLAQLLESTRGDVAALEPAADDAAPTWSLSTLAWNQPRLPAQHFLALEAVVEADAGPDVEADAPRQLELATTVQPDGQVFLSLQPWLASAEHQYRFIKEGQGLATVEELGGVELSPGEHVWWYDTAHQPRVVEDGQAVPFCGVIVNEERGVAGTGVDVALLEVWASFRQSPLAWLEGEASYGTNVVLGLRRVAGSERVSRLPRPVSIELSASGPGARAEPLTVQLQSVGEDNATVALRTARGDPAEEVTLVAHLAGEAFHFPTLVRPRAVALRLAVDADELAGFGLGRTTVTVERLAEDGAPLVEDRDLPVTLVVSGGHLPDGGSLVVPAGASRSEPRTLLSRGIDELTVSARAEPLVAEPLSVTLTWPWALVLAALVGGALGGWLRRPAPAAPASDAPGDGTDSDRGPAAAAGGAPIRRVLVGMVIGTTVVVGVVAGVVDDDLLPTSAAGSAAGAFVVALIAGYLGRAVLERLGKRLGLIAAD